jgi:hypothetical protein
MKAIDLTGQVFNRLTVISCAPDRNNPNDRARWLCFCICGNQKTISSRCLISQKTQSCGCIHKELLANRNKNKAKHNLCTSLEYESWHAMKQRCLNKNHHAFKRYGGRGISIYPPWINSFELFYSYLGNKPTSKHSIDRINNDGNYEPGNVKWATSKEQANNRRPMSCYKKSLVILSAKQCS